MREKQNKTKQNKTKNKTKQNKTKQKQKQKNTLASVDTFQIHKNTILYQN